MDFSDFIFRGKLNNLGIGITVLEADKKHSLHLIQKEEGDIPALYELTVAKCSFEIAAIKDTVIGITFDFEYEPENKYTLKHKSFEFSIGFATALEDLIIFLKDCNVSFENIDIDENNSHIIITNSGVTLRFYKTAGHTNLYKATLFDLELYNRLSLTI